MQFASAASDKTDTAAAVSDVAEQLQTQLGGCTPDLMLFFSNSHMDAGDVGALLAKSAGSGTVTLGASWTPQPGTGVMGASTEYQSGPAISVLAATLPGVTIQPFHAEPQHDGLPLLLGGGGGGGDVCGGGGGGASWAELATLPEAEAPHLLIFTHDVQSDNILRYLDNALPFSVKAGGLVPGGGELTLYSGSELTVASRGMVGVLLQGNIAVDTVVCQGAQPFGPVFEVTECDGSRVLSLDGMPADKVVQKALLDARKDIPRDTMHILAGVALDDEATRDRGASPLTDSVAGGAPAADANSSQTQTAAVRISSDYVVRHIMQVAPGFLRLDLSDSLLRTGLRFRLHAFSKETALKAFKSHMSELAALESATAGREAIRGALSIACLGRGEQLYGQLGVESSALMEAVGGASAQ